MSKIFILRLEERVSLVKRLRSGDRRGSCSSKKRKQFMQRFRVDQEKEGEV